MPQVVAQARSTEALMTALHAAKDFDSACKTLGYRAQEENPCIFFVKVEGKVIKLDATSRSGKMTVQEQNGSAIVVQLARRYAGPSYAMAIAVPVMQTLTTVLFGEYGRAINEQAVK